MAPRESGRRTDVPHNRKAIYTTNSLTKLVGTSMYVTPV